MIISHFLNLVLIYVLVFYVRYFGQTPQAQENGILETEVFTSLPQENKSRVSKSVFWQNKLQLQGSQTKQKNLTRPEIKRELDTYHCNNI